jgi:predicted nicotinamide N-methyase
VGLLSIDVDNSNPPKEKEDEEGTGKKPLCILELGAGLGCLGMALACNHNLPQSVAHSLQFTLTDYPTAIPMLQANVERNQNVFYLAAPTDQNENTNSNRNISILCQALDWNESLPKNNKDDTFPTLSSSSSSSSSFDVIVGSDLLYNVKQIPALIQTVNHLLERNSGIILLLVRWRKPELERVFFAETSREHNIHWTVVTTYDDDDDDDNDNDRGFLPCRLNWNQVGDPNCDLSNQYFGSGVQISVNGNPPKVLADITGEDANQMTKSECDQWGRAHMQVYRGQRRCEVNQAMDDEKIIMKHQEAMKQSRPYSPATKKQRTNLCRA